MYSIVFLAFAFIASTYGGERKPTTSSGGGLEEWMHTWGGSDSYSWAYALSLDGSGKIYLAGTAENIYGSWKTPSGTETSPSGTQGSPSGTEKNVSGTEGSPSGSETEPNGTQDEGGGSVYALVMKLYPQ